MALEKLKEWITTFMIAQDPYLREFVNTLPDGSAFITGQYGLGQMILLKIHEKNI